MLCTAGLWLCVTSAIAHAAEPMVKIELSPSAVQLTGADARQQLLLTATTSAGKQRDASRDAEYRSTNPQVATVDAAGVVLPVGNGRTEIVATFEGYQARVAVEVRDGDRQLPLDFTLDILPIFTKGGCNGGGCHGKSGGRGGFQLSLFGFDPRSDFDAIVKSDRGRRVFPASPDKSLLLTKPLALVPHGGGTRLHGDEAEYQRLRRWIATGTPWSAGSTSAKAEKPVQLVKIEVTPTLRALGHDEQQQIVVTAQYSDGTRRDVTRTTTFRSNDTSVADVDDQGLVTTHDRLGETAVVASYQGQVGVCRMVVPLVDSTVPQPELPISNFVDSHVLAKLRLLGVPPSALVEDAGFLRRAMLQIAGQTPTADDLQAFVADAATDKRTRLIDRLLASGEHADYFAQKWCDVLRIKRRGNAERLPATIAFHRWLRNGFAENRPFDEIVRDIVTATGNPVESPPAQWYHEVRYLDRYVDDTAQVFLGVRIGCARCHNHPFESYTQEDYFGLAAFFSRVDRKGGAGVGERRANETIYLKGPSEVRHPVTGNVVPPHGLGGKPSDGQSLDDPRHALVDWMGEKDNPYFARAFVNRMWSHFFGRGLVEPLDDLRVTNPASNEPLMDALAEEFVRSGFNVRHLLSIICQSSTYGLSSSPNQWNLADTQFNSRFYPQRLSAEVLLDAVDRVTSIPTGYSGLPAGTRATQLPDEDFSNNFLKLFGKPPRESACECERGASPNLGQSLFLMNDAFFLSKINNNKSLADQLNKAKGDERGKILRLFLTVLSREPSDDEMKAALAHVSEEAKPIDAYRNLLWALLNTKEFMYVR